MAQTGYTPIFLYSSSTTGNTPTLTNGASGSELGINITDGKLFYKDNSNALQVIGWKTTPTTAGGTGLTSWLAGQIPYYSSGTTLSQLAIGTSGQILTSSGTAPQWTTLSSVAVTTFSGGSTGLTPNSATSGAITLAGTLGVANGGTGLTTLASGSVPYGNGTSAFNSLSIGSANTVLTSSGSVPQWSTSLSLSGSVTAAGAFAATSTFSGSTPADGVVVDYSTGFARFSTFGSDGFKWFNGGIGTTALMQIASSGGVSIGNTTDPGATNLSVTGKGLFGAAVLVGGGTGYGAGSPGAQIGSPDSSGCFGIFTGGGTGYQWRFGNVTNGIVGSITTTTALTSYNVTSDRRLKENIVPFTNGLELVSQLKPSVYNYITDPSTQVQGFIADELQQVIPIAVTGQPNAVDAEGKPSYQEVDTSYIIPHLVSAIQELNTKFDSYVASHP
jgi:hypothetical protein